MTTSTPRSLSSYWPLFVLFVVSILAALALGSSMATVMHYFMGIFLLIFVTLKLFNPRSFADGFCMYDLLATRFKPYAYIYPLIELALSLAFLSFFAPFLTYLLTIIIMVFGAVGVFQGLKEGLHINCPCMGSVLNVPLSTVSLTEDIVMAAMAFILLIHQIINWF